MRLIRQAASGLLGLLIFFDLGLIYEYWSRGPDIVCGFAKFPCDYMGWIDGPIPYQSILFVFAIQIILIAFLWKSRRARSQ